MSSVVTILARLVPGTFVRVPRSVLTPILRTIRRKAKTPSASTIEQLSIHTMTVKANEDGNGHDHDNMHEVEDAIGMVSNKRY